MSQPAAMVLSIAIEAAVAAALIALLRWGSPARAALSATLGTLLTHWFAWHAAPPVMESIGVIPGFFVIETGVTLVEAAVYLVLVPVNPGRAFLLSLAANGSSAAVGAVLAAFNLLAPS
jgi:hypothetical protein